MFDEENLVNILKKGGLVMSKTARLILHWIMKIAVKSLSMPWRLNRRLKSRPKHRALFKQVLREKNPQALVRRLQMAVRLK